MKSGPLAIGPAAIPALKSSTPPIPLAWNCSRSRVIPSRLTRLTAVKPARNRGEAETFFRYLPVSEGLREWGMPPHGQASLRYTSFSDDRRGTSSWRALLGDMGPW